VIDEKMENSIIFNSGLNMIVYHIFFIMIGGVMGYLLKTRQAKR